MRRLRRALLTIGLIICGFYVAVLAGLYFKQRELIYPGAGGRPGLVASEVGFGEVMLPTDDGLKVRALYRAPQPGMPTLLMFHGNGEGVFESAAALRPLIPDGYGMLRLRHAIVRISRLRRQSRSPQRAGAVSRCARGVGLAAREGHCA